MSKLLFSQKLHILRMAKSGITQQARANQFGIEVTEVETILNAQASLETFLNREVSRKKLSPRDKLRVLNLMRIHKNQAHVGRICKIHRKTVNNVLDSRERLLADEAKGIPLNVNCPLSAKWPAIEADVIDFVKYARSKRLPVPSTHIKARGLRAPSRLNITNFRASNGCLAKFLRQSAIQRSFKLHGKGGLDLPTIAQALMLEFRSISSQYDIKKIYSVGESGLFYRMGPHQAYFTRNESRSTTRGTELQKHKRRVSILMCMNADGSHVLPVFLYWYGDESEMLQ